MTASSTTPSSPYSADSWKPFFTKAERFVQKTQEHALQGLNPGGVYQAIWCRDASYILRDWFLSGNIQGVLQQIYLIWSHQISPNKEKVIYGRGSPEMDFLPEVANADKEKEFEGALPTTIYQAGFSEIYGQSPDIDSIGLMISTTSWILARTLKQEGGQSLAREPSAQTIITASETSSDYVSALLSKAGITDPPKVIEFVVPRMLRAVESLKSRDIDNDGLLEQNHNEDWMDTTIRTGKIVYSQACWLLALNDLSALLSKLGRDSEANKLKELTDKTIHTVEQKLWSEEAGCYMDIEESHHIGGPYRMITQDVCLYLIAITENTSKDSFALHHEQDNNDIKKKQTKQQDQEQEQEQEQELNSVHQKLYDRATRSLDAIKSRVWKDKWALVTEGELKKTAPWVLKPYQYHNHTCWPWITGLEMIARSRFNQLEECNILISKLTSEDHLHIHTFYEWINPITDEGGGAYPFRTGISTVRIAIADIINKIKKESPSSSSL